MGTHALHGVIMGGREGGREGRREGGKEGGREGGRGEEREGEGGRGKTVLVQFGANLPFIGQM